MLDYQLSSPEERVEAIKQKDLTKLKSTVKEDYSNYILSALPRSKEILTDNRLVTINKREISYQGVSESLEAGEDGIYSILSDMGKSILLSPKIEITQEDIDEIPGLKQLRDDILEAEQIQKTAQGKRRFLLKKQIIEMRRQQYILKEGFRAPARGHSNTVRSLRALDLTEHYSLDENGEPQSDCLINIFNSKHVSAILCNYVPLKAQFYDKFNDDFYYLLLDFDRLVDESLTPMLRDLAIKKIQGFENTEIKQFLKDKYGVTHSSEYISSLWRNKIPKLISEKAKEEYLIYHYTFVEKGAWKKCSRCGEIKLAHSRFFSKNKSSRDGFYSICKACRRKKSN